VSKQARVVEEVVVGKEATERTETVRDTVRRTDVEVEKTDPNQSGTTRKDTSRDRV
jgi:stress response protein YsnF